MSNVGAYIDLPKWESAPITEQNLWGEGELNSQGPEGLDVSWWDSVPDNAQVYIEWTPRVFAVWEEEEIEDGDGNEAESAGPNPDEEVDEEPGQPGDFAGEATGSGPEEPEAVGGEPV